MSHRTGESLGPIQVAEVTQFALNDAFRQLVERIDTLKGLHGDHTIFGETTFETVRITDTDGNLIHAFGVTE